MKKYSFLFFALALFSYPMFSQNTFEISGGTVNVSGGVKLVLHNTKWINNAEFTATNGTVELTGDASQANSSIGGTKETSFYNLTINKSLNSAELGQNITIENTLNLTNGQLELNDKDVTLIGNFTLGVGSYIQTSGGGKLSQTINTGNSKIFPVGNGSFTPVTIQNDGTSDIYSVRNTAGVLENGTTGNAQSNEVVNQTWHITEAVAGASNLTITAQWNASDELTGFDRNNCAISHYTSSWDAPTNSVATGSDPYSLSRSNITSLSPFAVASNGVLPTELIAFRAFKQNDDVKLEWQTANEINSDLFEIEHSRDAISYHQIGEIKAALFSDTELSYEFLDKNAFIGTNYYRLKMKDIDGSFKYSETRNVNFHNIRGLEKDIIIYPNPVSDIIYLQFSQIPQKASLQLYNKLGQLILDKTLLSSIQNQVKLKDISTGVYFLNIQTDGQQSIHKIFIN